MQLTCFIAMTVTASLAGTAWSNYDDHMAIAFVFLTNALLVATNIQNRTKTKP